MRVNRPKLRNLAARSPLLRKGGVHSQGEARGPRERQSLDEALWEWEEAQGTEERGARCPPLPGHEAPCGASS
jgi:hypothetical protein